MRRSGGAHGCVSGLEENALGGESVQDGRRVPLMSVGADSVGPQRVDRDQQDVRGRWTRTAAPPGAEERQQQEAEPPHEGSEALPPETMQAMVPSGSGMRPKSTAANAAAPL